MTLCGRFRLYHSDEIQNDMDSINVYQNAPKDPLIHLWGCKALNIFLKGFH